MKLLIFFPLCLLLSSCKKSSTAQTVQSTPNHVPATTPWSQRVIRVLATQQAWNPRQPWEKEASSQSSMLAAVVGKHQVLVTADLVSDLTNLSFESVDGTRFAKAKLVAVDYEVNLALLETETPEAGDKFFEGFQKMEFAPPSTLQDNLQIVQIENNGQPLITLGKLQKVDITRTFLVDQNFLTYHVKASMQNASTSSGMPVVKICESGEPQLSGIFSTYNNEEQISLVIPAEVIQQFLKGVREGKILGSPSLGVQVSTTDDPVLRQWLQLPENGGGVHVNTVNKGGAADQAGLLRGDVILEIQHEKIDRRGYYEDKQYGSLYWSHLIRGKQHIGDEISLSIVRKGKAMELKIKLTHLAESSRLVPQHCFDRAPQFLIKGGLLFQELSIPWLQAYGDEWRTRAPLGLLAPLESPSTFEPDMEHVVFLSGVIPTPATIGYDGVKNLIIKSINGIAVRDMKSLHQAFVVKNEIHSIEFRDEDVKLYLDEKVSSLVDANLKKRGLPRLSHIE